MADISSTCPSVDQLKALIDGQLSDDKSQAIQQHVDQCSACQTQLEMVVAGTESWDAAIGRVRQGEEPFNNTVFSEAMKRIKADELSNGGEVFGKNSANPFEYLSPSDKPDSIGRLGPYEVTQVIGQGGMGIVLKAYDPSLHRVVAVKILAPYLAHNSNARKRFVREAQAIAAVSHDHVITIHAIDESAERPMIVMQFVAGQSLQQKIDAEGSLDLKEILRIGMQTASGLSAAHAQGLVHRDVKPSNILLENGIQRVKLTDFGLARAVDDASLTQSGAIAGTPQYMAPEQANGDAVDYRADLFSLGSVMYSMCVGHSPFRASTTMGVLKRVCHDPPRPIQELTPDIPSWLSSIIMRLLAKQPDDRYQSAREVAELLERWLAHVQQPSTVFRPIVSRDPVSNAAPEAKASVKSHPGESPFTWPFSRSIRYAIGLCVLMALLVGGVSPLEIMILALIGWGAVSLWKRLDKSRVREKNDSPDFVLNEAASRATSTFKNTVDEVFRFTTPFVQRAAATVEKTGARVAQQVQTWDWQPLRSQLLFAGWCTVSLIDLAWLYLLFLEMRPTKSLLPIPIAMSLCLASVFVAHALFCRQNLQIVFRGAVFGLLPLTPGAFLRIPLAIVTLIWLRQPTAQNSFIEMPWGETELCRAIISVRSWIARWFGTGVRLSVWSLVCGIALFVAYVFCQVPNVSADRPFQVIAQSSPVSSTNFFPFGPPTSFKQSILGLQHSLFYETHVAPGWFLLWIVITLICWMFGVWRIVSVRHLYPWLGRWTVPATAQLR